MKKSLLSLAVLSAISFGAYADGVELYGTLDVAVASIPYQLGADGVSPTTVSITDAIGTSTTQSWSGMVNGGISQSRWGIKGSETIDSDLQAIFNLEGCIVPLSGSVCDASQALQDSSRGTLNNLAASSADGQLFGRKAFFGLKSKDMGTITFGRNEVLGADVMGGMGYVSLQNAQQFTPSGYSGTIGGSLGETEYGRYDNSVKYTYKMDNGVNVGAIYGFGNKAGSTSASSAYQINLGYEQGAFGIQGVYGSIKDAMKGGACGSSSCTTGANGIYAEFYDVYGFMLATKYKFNDNLKLTAGYERFTYDTPSNGTTDISTTTYYGKSILSYDYLGEQQSVTYTWLGFDYQLTPASTVGLMISARNYQTCSGAIYSGITTYGTNTNTYIDNGKCGLTQNYVSGLYDYNFSKRTDVYAGFMTSQPGGSIAYKYLNESIVAVGIRHKF